MGKLAVKYGADSPEKDNNYTLFENFLAEENLSKFSLEDAARHFGIDKFKFLRLFKFQTGLTPNNYFILKRIEKSKILLAQGNDLLSVAVDLGFYDAAHFSNHFKKFTGISPIAYTSGS
jgi:AraC-like DNA-binding protein